jgi:hypothetical protein
MIPGGGQEALRRCHHLPEITGRIRASSRKRYGTVLDKCLAFCEQRRIRQWQAVNADILNKYGAELEGENYLWRNIYLELNRLKQVVKFLNQGKTFDGSRTRAIAS